MCGIIFLVIKMMIDTHCHLDIEDYPDLDVVIKKMENNIIIVSGANNNGNRQVIDLCNKYVNIYGTIGIHPEEIDDNITEYLKFIEDNISNPKIVGIGEIGLDYHYNDVPKDTQRKYFIKQLDMARKYNKSVVIHTREAMQETYDILKDYSDLKIDIHCYSGSLEMANQLVKLGCKLGIGGVLTFKNSEKIKDVVTNIDLRYLMLETDSPYLTPEPFRGKRNEPYNIYYVALKIAELKNISLEEVLKITTSNAISQFDLKDIL